MLSRNADNLLLFKSIVDAGSISTAARTHDISISQASKRMSQLEHALGIKLLQRSTRTLTLTKPGQLLYQKLSTVRQHMDEAWNSLLDYGNEPRGILNVRAEHHFAIYYIIPQLKKFQAKQKNITIKLSLDQDCNNKKHDFDIEFKSHILEKERLIPDSLLKSKKILSEPMVCIASKEYLKKHGQPQTPDLLERHRSLSIETDKKTKWVFYQGQQVFSYTLEPTLLANNYQMILHACREGLGIARVPRTLLKNIDSRHFTELFKNYQTETLDTYAYYDSSQAQLKKITLFIENIDVYNKNPIKISI